MPCADEPFKASAFRKVGRAINNYPEKITSSKQVGHVKGIGKGSMQKVSTHIPDLATLQDCSMSRSSSASLQWWGKWHVPALEWEDV